MRNKDTEQVTPGQEINNNIYLLYVLFFWGGGSRHKSMFKVFEDMFTITSITITVSKCY